MKPKIPDLKPKSGIFFLSDGSASSVPKADSEQWAESALMVKIQG
jgi:hypothetical protein